MEYFYGDMGEVEKEIRTLRISPSEVQTYVTEYEYDSWNRIQTMTYPDGERLDFGYNIAGNLTSLKGVKSSPNPSEGGGHPANGISGSSPSGTEEYSYIAQQGYDEFEQKIYRRLGNDTETTYTYEPVMRRLLELKATRLGGNNGGLLFQNNRYSYDLVGNILSVENAISQQPSAISSLGGSSKYAYEYDELNRLIKARGQFEGVSNKADYELNMQYNKLNGIVQKALQYTLNGQDKGYTLDYKYDNKNHPHAPSLIANSQSPKARNYQYDGNGNPVSYDEFKSFRSMVWDEENRLRGINDNGRLHLYTYDHTGERALKSSAESSMAVINGLASAVITHTEDYTAYVSPYFVVQKGKFTKHYFEGSSRVVSKLGEGTFSHKNTGIMAGGLDYLRQTAEQQRIRDEYIKGLQVPPGPPTQHGIYATPEWTGEAYPSVDWQSISQNQEPPAGWPRYPRFNEPGDVPGPPVQFGEAITNANVKAGYGYINNGVEEKNLYFYHPDHLGSSSYITDKEGNIVQHTEYIAFGETFVDEHSVSKTMPYLFNAKELDFETGLYYYGARYYDAKTSIFLNVDPLVEKTMSPYAYVNNNPVNLIDPTGMEAEDPPKWNHYTVTGITGSSKISFERKSNPDPWTINTFFGDVKLPNPTAVNAHILHVGTEDFMFSSYKQLAIYANAIDWDTFDATREVRFKEYSTYQGDTYKIGKRPITLTDVRNNIASLQELSCNCGAVLMGGIGMTMRSSLPISNRIRGQKQASEHIIGGNRLGNNSYLNSMDDAKEVLNAAHSGKAKVLSTNYSQNRTYIEYKGVTGYYNNNGNSLPTNRFMIKGGGSNGATVVPIHPKSNKFK